MSSQLRAAAYTGNPESRHARLHTNRLFSNCVRGVPYSTVLANGGVTVPACRGQIDTLVMVRSTEPPFSLGRTSNCLSSHRRQSNLACREGTLDFRNRSVFLKGRLHSQPSESNGVCGDNLNECQKDSICFVRCYRGTTSGCFDRETE